MKYNLQIYHLFKACLILDKMIVKVPILKQSKGTVQHITIPGL